MRFIIVGAECLLSRCEPLQKPPLDRSEGFFFVEDLRDVQVSEEEIDEDDEGESESERYVVDGMHQKRERDCLEEDDSVSPHADQLFRSPEEAIQEGLCHDQAAESMHQDREYGPEESGGEEDS